jgi:hypothetical protein
MRSATTLAAAFLAFGFGVVVYIAIWVEPAMGFLEPADFFDPGKVAAGLGSTPWLVDNLLFLSFPVAFLVISRSSANELVGPFGLAAAVFFLLLGSMGRAANQLPSFLSSEEELRVALAGMLPVRFAVLKASVVAMGLFAWSTTRSGGGHGLARLAWRAFGWFVLAASVSFLFVFLPLPIVFFPWAIGLTVTSALAGARAGKEPVVN